MFIQTINLNAAHVTTSCSRRPKKWDGSIVASSSNNTRYHIMRAWEGGRRRRSGSCEKRVVSPQRADAGFFSPRCKRRRRSVDKKSFLRFSPSLFINTCARSSKRWGVKLLDRDRNHNKFGVGSALKFHEKYSRWHRVHLCSPGLTQCCTRQSRGGISCRVNFVPFHGTG